MRLNSNFVTGFTIGVKINATPAKWLYLLLDFAYRNKNYHCFTCAILTEL